MFWFLLFQEIRGEGRRKRGNKKEMGLVELFDKSIEQKGLGVKLGETKTPRGTFPNHIKYAILVAHGKGFNVQIICHPTIGPKEPDVYLFPKMVSEEEARREYDRLN